MSEILSGPGTEYKIFFIDSWKVRKIHYYRFILVPIIWVWWTFCLSKFLCLLACVILHFSLLIWKVFIINLSFQGDFEPILTALSIFKSYKSNFFSISFLISSSVTSLFLDSWSSSLVPFITRFLPFLPSSNQILPAVLSRGHSIYPGFQLVSSPFFLLLMISFNPSRFCQLPNSQYHFELLFIDSPFSK